MYCQLSVDPPPLVQEKVFANGRWSFAGKIKTTRHKQKNPLIILLYSWKCFRNRARSHWLLRGLMKSDTKTVSRQNLWAGNIAKSMTSDGNIALLPANVDRRPLFLRDSMNFLLQKFQLYNKSLKDRSLGKQLILFPSNLNVSRGGFWGNKINCFPREQSLRVYYLLLYKLSSHSLLTT